MDGTGRIERGRQGTGEGGSEERGPFIFSLE